MSFLNTNNKTRSIPLSKTLFTSSAASVLSAFMLMAVAPTAHAQVVIDVTDCADLMDNPGTADAGATVNIDIGGACVVTSGDHIDLEDGDQDDVTINIASGTILRNSDTSDEDTVIFIDNSENNTTINIADGAALWGENGVIFIEGDGTTIVNDGDIIGTGEAEEGVIYIDRDTDSDTILINNRATGRITAQDNGPAIGIEVLLADGFDDPEHVGVQDDLADFPTVTIINQSGGLIQSTGSVSDDNDAINIAGSPGTTGGLDRACIEGAALNCVVNLRVINSGIIRSVFDNSGTAAITIEDDALFNGVIVNRVDGLVTGTRNGMRIGDIEVDGATAEHSGRITNLGTISGTGTSSRGIDLEGDGIRITNGAAATISGLSVGIEVGAGSSSGVDHSGESNSIVNRGTISGDNYSIDSTAAEGVIRIVNFGGGSFDGDIRGSAANLDLLNFRNGDSSLTHDVLQNFAVTVAPTGNLTFVGDRTIEGTLLSRGTVSFDLADTQTVTGNVQLTRTSTVAISDTTGVAALNAQFTLIDVGGALINNAALDSSEITDSSFLLDFEFVDSADLVVEAIAAGSGTSIAKVSGYLEDIQFKSEGAQVFGTNVLTAFVDGTLDNTSTFSNLGGLGTASDVGTAVNSLAPDFSGALVQNVFSSIQSNNSIIDHRLSNLNCNSFGSDDEESCLTLAESGAWLQASRPNATQGSLALSAPTFLNTGAGQDSVTMTYGYDHAVADSTIVGFSGSYTDSELEDQGETASSTDLESVQFSAYAGHRVGNAQFTTKASYSHAEAHTRRQSFDVIKSEVDVNALNFQGVASYNVYLGQGYYLKPEAGVHYNNLSTGAYTETGGLDLSIGEANTNVLDGRVGMTLGSRQILSEKARADLFVTALVRNDFYGNRDDIGFAFAGQTGSLAVANTDQFAVQGLAGVNLLSGKNFSFGGAVNGEFANTENSVGASLQTNVRW